MEVYDIPSIVQSSVIIDYVELVLEIIYDYNCYLLYVCKLLFI